ncbi:hypothetical protein [Ralstonia pseudosolanacearum]|uniref:hypothetical protein n=1 Tax=Ralstonia pseudosolanacearum TaxID=1310165 RepID=UPI001FF8141A|nr:hypothetical protein [Ralstonia pseudosolanacearum]
MSATIHHAIRLLSIAALATALAACGGKQQSSAPAPAFNQKLTDLARSKWSLPADVEKVECWAEQPLVQPNRAFCNVYFRGRAPKDIGQEAIGWDIPVRASSRFDGMSGEEPRYLDTYQFDLALLASTKFLFVAKNASEGLSIEVVVNQDRVPLSEAEKFIASVLPLVSKEMSAQLNKARVAAPDSVRSTWSSK